MKQLLASLLLSLAVSAVTAGDGHQLIGWTNFSTFTRTTNASGEIEWLSPRTDCRPADEFVASWNAELGTGAWMRVELRAFHEDKATKFFDLGHWSRDPVTYPRESVNGQKDADGDVDTDTLKLRSQAGSFQFRLMLGAATNQARLKMLSVCSTDTRVAPAQPAQAKPVWGKPPLPVPTRSQMLFPGGGGWCSPTTVSMLLAFWSKELSRPDLDCDVPEVASGVYDSTWKGTGNWSFNMAFAGARPGLRACVVRLGDIGELEELVSHGFPVGVSLCYDRLRGVGRGPNGHLMVCVGFDHRGYVILNDPGTRHKDQMQKTISRERFADAWDYSHHTAYLVYPEGAKLPPDPSGHWTIGSAE